MARNRHPGVCYECGLCVEPDTGHFERHNGGWRVKHANVNGFGRVTCEDAKRKDREAISDFEELALVVSASK